jgi:hypothetical protein
MFKNFNRAHLPLRIRSFISRAVRTKPPSPSRMHCQHEPSQTQNPNAIHKLRRSAVSVAVNVHPTLFKLRRSAMSIAADAPGSSSSSVGAAWFLEGSWQGLFRFRACTASMTLIKPRIPKGFSLKAQGWRACEPTLRSKRRKILNPNGVAPIRDRSVHGKPQHSRNAHCDHEPARRGLLPLPIRWGEGRGEGFCDISQRTVHGKFQQSRNGLCDHEPISREVGFRMPPQMRPGSRRPSRPFSRCCAAPAHFSSSGRPTRAESRVELCTRKFAQHFTFAHRPGRRFPLTAI